MECREVFSLVDYMGKLLSFWYLLLLPALAWSQVPDLRFHHITEANGLSYNIVNCFLKDSRGLLWIGTYSGLNRYDGSHFKIFKKEKQANSLSDNAVHDLAEDQQGNIWGATEAGIFCFNPNTGIFKNYLTLPEKEPQVVYNVLVDNNGIVWASNYATIIKYDKSSDRFSDMKLDVPSQKLFGKFFARKNGLVASPDGKGLWVATRSGLLYYDIGKGQIQAAKNLRNSELFTPNSASGLCATVYGHYWYYDNIQQALLGFEPIGKKLKYMIQPKTFSRLGGVATVFEDRNHMIWLSTWDYEIYMYDYLGTGTLTRIQNNKAVRTTIAGDFFWDALQEEDGTLWLGTVGGISRVNTQKAFYKIHYFPESLMEQYGASFDFITESKPDRTWWLGTTNYLLLNYDPRSGKTVVFNLSKFPKSRNGHTPFKVNNIIAANKDLYMFCNPGVWVKRGSKPFELLSIKGIADTVMLHQGEAVNDSIFWMTNNQIMWKWNHASNNLQKFEYDPGVTIDNSMPYTHFMALNSDGEPWLIAGDDQFAHPVGTKLEMVKPAAKKTTGSIGYYTAMSADNAGNFWVVKKGEGLFRFHPKSGAYELYRQYDGLALDHIMDATVDSTGRIWSAAYNQFSVFNPALKSFTNFILPINENRYGYENYMTTLSNGNVLSTVADKVVEFIPKKLTPFDIKVKPVISAVVAGSNEKPLPLNGRMILDPSENDLRFQFGLLADREESPFVIQYMLDGAEENWNTATVNFDATYNKLAPGNYTFKVRAIAKDKSWQTEETRLTLKLAAPFYRTSWFTMLLAAFVSLCIYALYRYRLQKHRQVLNLESKAQLLEKEKAMVMFENLKQQLNPHFLFNSLTSLSGLIEADQSMANEFLDQMSGIYRYILKHADSDKVPLREELAFVRLYIHLQQTRFDDGLQVRIDVPEEYLHYKIAPVTLQNLIENAIKHNIIDATSPLVIEIYVQDDYLVVENNLQKKKAVETSNQKGLVQFSSLYRFLSEKPVLIDESDTTFKISIPLI